MSGRPTNIGRCLDKRLLWLALPRRHRGIMRPQVHATLSSAEQYRRARGARPAPEIELYDQSSPSRIVRLEAYLGRQRVIVVFFDGPAGAHSSTMLSYLRENWNRLRQANIYVMAISTALPQENRKDIASIRRLSVSAVVRSRFSRSSRMGPI